METWLEVEDDSSGTVHLAGYNHFLATDETVIARETLRFRSAAEWISSLADAGFAVERTCGDWVSGPLLPASPIMIFIARRPEKPPEEP